MFWCEKYMKFFDLHCDTPYECYVKNQEFKSNRLAVSADKGGCFDVWYQTFAVWIKDDAKRPYILYKNILNSFKEKLRCCPDNLYPIFALEGGAAVENTDCLYEMKKDGIKMITLTWNGENKIAGGSKSDKGLTDFGRQVIEVMNQLGICCDLSHLNEKSFFSAMQYTLYPVATHSNCKAVCNHPRNLTDEQIKFLCQKGGIIGLCPYPEFLRGDVAEKLYENICHICDMGYEDNIAFGSDFDGAKQDKILSDIGKIPCLFKELEQKGLEKRLLCKIFYENAYNFIAKIG